MICHILISGFVQGIGFRAFVKKHAREMGLKGWVTNTGDGKVEALFVGTKEKIDQMIKLCKKGPFLAQVRNVEVKLEDRDKAEYQSFEIVH
jgi:acylphosphatase